MILNSEQTVVETNLPKQNRGTFKVKVDGALFQILAKNVYSNPVLATLSELGQNAYDSHKRIGKENIPFIVQLPNTLEPTLRIRDFGCGMSNDYILNEYITAFESSKRNSDNEAGGYGIGKLSAFSLSPTYNIVVYENGVARNYSCFTNGGGAPDIILVGEFETTEENGVSISIPIEPRLISQFETAAKNAYHFYPTRPIITGVHGFKYHDSQIHLSGDNWHIETSAPIDKPHAICGIYYYPIEFNNIQNFPEELKNFAQSKAGIVLKFNVGEITPQANRQGLLYDEMTSNAIISRLNDMSANFRKSIQKEFDNIKTFIGAKRFWNSVFLNSQNPLFKIAGFVSRATPFVWNGINISDDKINNHTVPVMQNGHPVVNGVISVLEEDIKVYSLRYRRGHYTMQEGNHVTIPITNDTTVVIADAKASRARIKKALMENVFGKKQGVPSNSNIQSQIVISFPKDIMKNAAFIAANPGFSIEGAVSAETLPPPAPGAVGYRSSIRGVCFAFNPNGRISRSAYSGMWDKLDDIDIEDGGIYIDIYNFVPTSAISIHTLREDLESMKKFGLIDADEQIIGIRQIANKTTAEQEFIDAIKNSADWIEYSKFRTQMAEKLLKESKDAQFISDSIEYNNAKGSILFGDSVFTLPSLSNDWDEYTTKIRELQSSANQAVQHNEKQTFYKKVMGNGFTPPTVPPKYKIHDLNAKIRTKYPMIDYAVKNTYAWDVKGNTTLHKNLSEYFKLVDSCTK